MPLDDEQPTRPILIDAPYLEKSSLIPTPGQWLRASSVGHKLRTTSQIKHLDAALEAWWKTFDRARNGRDLKDDLAQQHAALGAAIDNYLEHKGFGQSHIKAVFEPGPQVAVEVIRGQIRRESQAGRWSRIAHVLALRRIWSVEEKRLHLAPGQAARWPNGTPPTVDATDYWDSYTCLPELELWQLESSGADDTRWTARRRSTITRLDAKLKEFWEAFCWADRTAALDHLTEIEGLAVGYCQHKEGKDRAPRLLAVQRILAKSRSERVRLEREWTELLPPRHDRSQPSVPESPLREPVGMELRVLLPPVDKWLRHTSVLGKVRSSSFITAVDRALSEFWAAFRPGNRTQGLDRLDVLIRMAGHYQRHKSGKSEENRRLSGVNDLRELAQIEWLRLEREWPEDPAGVPPLLDEDAEDGPPSAEEAAIKREAQGEVLALQAACCGDPGSGEAVELPQRPAPDPLGHLKRQCGDKKKKKNLVRDLAGIQAFGLAGYGQQLKQAGAKLKDAQHDAQLQGSYENLITLAGWLDSAASNIIDSLNPPAGTDGPDTDHCKTPDNFLTTSFVSELAASGDVLIGLYSLYTTVRTLCANASKKGWKEAWREQWLDVDKDTVGAALWSATKTAIHVGNALEGMPGRAAALHAGSTDASQGATGSLSAAGQGGQVAGLVCNFGGPALGVVSSLLQLRTTWKTHRSLTSVGERFAALWTSHADLANFIDTTPAFRHLQHALAGKLGRRKTRAKIEGAQALVGIASGGMGIASTALVTTAAIATVWNPIGWTLIGLGVLGTIGMLSYKSVRRQQRKQQLQDLRLLFDIPPWIHTAGDWERFQMADLMYRAALFDVTLQMDWRAIGYALLFILLGGEGLESACQEARRMGHAGIMAFIKG